MGFPHNAQLLPAYHRTRMLRTRQSSGAAATSRRHSCPQPAFSGQREQELSFKSGAERRAVAAACPAFTRTPAGWRFSGQVITRAPWNRVQARTRRTARKTTTAAATTTVNTEGDMVNSTGG